MARVLLAEDDAIMRDFLTRSMQKAGHEVVAVNDGVQAVPLLDHDSFDLLLTDIVMPELDGIALAKRARAQDPGLKVVFITGFAAVAMQQQERLEDVTILSKPFHLKDMVAEIERLLNA